MAFIQFRSAPAQKALPCAPSTTTRRSSSCDKAVNVSVSAAITSSLNALRTSGRLSHTCATWALGWETSSTFFISKPHSSSATSACAFPGTPRNRLFRAAGVAPLRGSRAARRGCSITLCNLFEHHFGGATTDGQHARIAPQPFNGRLPDEAHAAVELLTGLHHFVDQLATQRFQHRHLLHDVVALCHAPGAVVHELPGRAHLGVQHRQALADGLLIPKRGAKGLPLAHIVQRELERLRA